MEPVVILVKRPALALVIVLFVIWAKGMEQVGALIVFVPSDLVQLASAVVTLVAISIPVMVPVFLALPLVDPMAVMVRPWVVAAW